MTAFIKVKTGKDTQLINLASISRIRPDAFDKNRCYIYLVAPLFDSRNEEPDTLQSGNYNYVHAFASMDEIIVALTVCGCHLQ